MIFFTGSKPSGKWTYTLLKLRECWVRGEKTALLAPGYIRLEDKEEYLLGVNL